MAKRIPMVMKQGDTPLPVELHSRIFRFDPGSVSTDLPVLSENPFALASEVLESTTDAVYVLDYSWHFVYMNAVARRLVPGGVSVLGRNVWEAFPEAVNLEFWPAYHRTMIDRIPTEFAIYYPEPVNRSFELSTYPTAQGISVFFRDVTTKRAEEERLRMFEQAVASAPVGIVISPSGPAGNCPLIYVNPAFERITGYLAEEVLGKDCNFLGGPDGTQEGCIQLNAAINAGEPVKVLLRNYRKDGRLFDNELQLSPVRNDSGKLTHLVGILDDVTEQIAAREKLAYQAKHDALTGLANRYLLIERLRDATVTAILQDRQIAVLILDLDNFKHVNDSLGHMDADHLLIQISRRLSASVDLTDTVARLGGDEFAIVLLDYKDQATVIKRIERMMLEIRKPVSLGNRELVVTASVGISLFPQDTDDADELLLLADLSMYSVKRSGKNSHRFYLPELRSNRNEPLDIAVGLRKALVNQEFELYYQPRLRAATSEVLGFEALIRWRHPTRGILLPAQFIGIAEDTGMINDIGQWAIEEALRQNAAWRNSGLIPVSMSVNVSAVQVRDPYFQRSVGEILARSGLPAESFEVELTESLLLDHARLANATLQGLKELGIRIAIDDFGSGYSGLHYLSRFPVDTIKIDQFFTVNIASDKTAATICRSVMRLGRELGLTTVAEGIELEEQAVLLRKWRCTELQGFMFANPMPSHLAASYLLAHTVAWGQPSDGRTSDFGFKMPNLSARMAAPVAE